MAPGPMTLGDVQRRDEDPERDNEYYAGGAQSGMAVQDPNSAGGGRDAQTRGERIQGIFDSAREHGAEQGTAEDLGQAAPAAARAFSGAGRRLDGTAAGAGGSGGADGVDAAAEPAAVPHVVYFWDNGFSVDDGPLRSLEDPANRSFIETLQSGQCPRELAPADPNAPVNVNLVRKDGPYVEPPKPKYVAFGGSGRTLGASSTAPAPAAPAAPAAAPSEFSVDDSKPTTRVQIRLADGQRVVARFNETHTIADVRNFIRIQQGSAAPAAFTLVTGPPAPKTLDDDAATLKDAGLLGAVILQK